LKSDVQFTDQYDTLDLSSFSECTTIASSAFSCEGTTTKNVLNKKFFGSAADYGNNNNNFFDSNGNFILRNTTLDGPIKYLFLPDSITAINNGAFRRAYSFNSQLILPLNLTELNGFPLHFCGFISCEINENYLCQGIANYKPFYFPFLSGLSIKTNNPAFTLHYHYNKFGTVDGWLVYPKKYALTQIRTTGYYLSDGNSNNGKMGFGQKPLLAVGTIDMKNMLDYSKN
jgi:hypothetical protein